MTSLRIQKDLKDGIYFITCTVRNWYHVLDRKNRWNILLNSLKYCQNQKGLKIYAWVFMMDHIHLLVEHKDVIGFLRDFKRHTTREMKKSILAHEPRTAKLFETPEGFQFWGKTNMPEKVENFTFFEQKYQYIHFNPVKKQYVRNPQDWVFSSANQEELLSITQLEA